MNANQIFEDPYACISKNYWILGLSGGLCGIFFLCHSNVIVEQVRFIVIDFVCAPKKKRQLFEDSDSSSREEEEEEEARISKNTTKCSREDSNHIIQRLENLDKSLKRSEDIMFIHRINLLSCEVKM